MNKTITHEFKSRYRTGRMVITEQPGKVLMKLRFNRYGEFKDAAKVAAWLLPLIIQYEEDPRPIVMDNPHSGEVATIDKINGTAVAFVRHCDT